MHTPHSLVLGLPYYLPRSRGITVGLMWAGLFGGDNLEKGMKGWFRRTVRTSCVICPREILAIIASEIEMVQSVVRGRVDELLHLRVGGYDHVRIVDKYAPKVHHPK